MCCALWVLSIAMAAQGASSVSGHVIGPDGKAIAQAKSLS